MIKKYSLEQFSAKDFIGYREVMEREHNKENRFGMIKFFGGINIFLMIFGLLFYYYESDRSELLIVSILYIMITIVYLCLYYFTRKKNNVSIQFIGIGIQFLFFSLFFLYVCKDVSLESNIKSYFLLRYDSFFLDFSVVFFWFFFAVLGYLFYVDQIKKGTYTPKSSYIQYVKKNTTTDYRSKYQKLKPWLLGLILLGPSVPTAIVFFDEEAWLFICGLFVGYGMIFITPLCFIAAYFCKKFPELTEDKKSKVKKKK